jgi:uncharacterized protein YjbI with pentapeptide repeats
MDQFKKQKYVHFNEYPEVHYFHYNDYAEVPKNADLRDAIIYRSALHYVSAIEADFTKSVLIESDLYRGNLRGSIFDKANLSYAICVDADFEDSSFEESILRQTNFRNSKLCNTNFFSSEFDGANLTDANLHNALFNTNPYYAGVYNKILNLHGENYTKNPVSNVTTWDGNMEDSYRRIQQINN